MSTRCSTPGRTSVMETRTRKRTRWTRAPFVLLFALVLVVALNRTFAVLVHPITWENDWWLSILDGVLFAAVVQAFRNWWYS